MQNRGKNAEIVPFPLEDQRLGRLQEAKKLVFPGRACEAAVAHCSVNCLPPPPHILLIGGHQNWQEN